MRWLDGAGGARGPAGGADAETVEEKEDGFGFDVGEGNVGGVGKARFAGAVAGGVGDGFEKAGFEAIAHGAYARVFFGEMFLGEFGGAAERDDVGNIFGAGAMAVFLMTAEDVWEEFGALFDVEKADAFWGVKFVAGKTEEIDTEGFDVDF